MRTYRLYSACVLLALGACQCGDEVTDAHGVLEVSPKEIDFGTVPLTTQERYILDVRNAGTGPLTIEKVEIFEGDALLWTIDLATPKTIEPGNTVDAIVSFRSELPGEYEAVARIVSDAPKGANVVVPLTVRAVGPEPTADCRAGCTSTPGPACADAKTLRTYSGPGTCDRLRTGTCEYPSADKDCSQPPAPACASATETRTFTSGSCEAGACRYEEVVTPCPAPPAATCLDAATLESYAAGQCSNGVCTFAKSQVACGTPPAPTCVSASQLKTFSAGSCSNGSCNFGETLTNCDVAPPPPTCASANSVKTFAQGRCAGGACGFLESVTPCNNPPSSCHVAIGACNGGTCTYAFDDGKACNDGNACTTNETCQQGVCKGTPPLTQGFGLLANHATLKSASRLALSSPFDVWTVGDSDNAIGQWNGCSYTRCTGLSNAVNDPNAACWKDSAGNAARLRDVASLAPGKFVAVGDKGMVAMSGTSTCYTLEYAPNVNGKAPHLTGVWAENEALLYAVGEESCTGQTHVFRRTGSGWAKVFSPTWNSTDLTGVSLYRVYGRAGEVYAVGGEYTNTSINSVIYSPAGSLWSKLAIPAIYSINDLYLPPGSDEIYAAGYDNGIDVPVLLIYRNNSWERWDRSNGRLPAGMKNLGGVYAVGGKIFVSTAGNYQVWTWNGAGWTSWTSSLTQSAISELEGSGNHLFFLQSAGAQSGLWRGP